MNKLSTCTKSVLSLVVLLLAFAEASRTVGADPPPVDGKSKRETAGKIAKRATELFPKGTKTITIHSLTVIGATDDLGIANEIRLAFEAMKEDKEKLFEIVPHGGDAEVSGEVRRNPKDSTEKVTGLVIELKLSFKLGPIESKSFKAFVSNNRFDVAPVTDSGDIEKAPAKDAPDPKKEQCVDKFQIARGSHSSPYGVQIVVRDPEGTILDQGRHKYSVRPIEEKKGCLHVKLKKGEIFAINLINNSDYEAAATVFLDGLDRYVLADRQQHRDNPFDLIPKKDKRPGERLIVGYFRNGKEVYSFKVGDYENSVKALKLPQAKEGNNTITIAFSASWKPGDDEPPNETENKPNSDIAIEKGPIIDDATTSVPRSIGKRRTIIRITYSEE